MGRSVISKCNRRIIVLKVNALHISFVVNLLARFSSAPTQCHWTGIKAILCYLKGTMDMSLFYPYIERQEELKKELQTSKAL
jgi:hypothetical protein